MMSPEDRVVDEVFLGLHLKFAGALSRVFPSRASRAALQFVFGAVAVAALAFLLWLHQSVGRLPPCFSPLDAAVAGRVALAEVRVLGRGTPAPVLAQYRHASERWMLSASVEVLASLGVPQRVHNISLTSSSCLGGGSGGWAGLALESVVGFDSLVASELQSAGWGGYVMNADWQEVYPLSPPPPQSVSSAALLQALLTALFLFVSVETLIKFTLAHTQLRMVRFSQELRERLRRRLRRRYVVVRYALRSLGFVPACVGILFFLFEFYRDRKVAFLVMVFAWGAQFFLSLSVRTLVSRRLFPAAHLLLHVAFTTYVLAAPLGHHQVAFWSMVSGVFFVGLYCMMEHEVPAVEIGTVSVRRPREEAGGAAAGGSDATRTAPGDSDGARVSRDQDQATASGDESGYETPQQDDDPPGGGGPDLRNRRGAAGRQRPGRRAARVPPSPSHSQTSQAEEEPRARRRPVSDDYDVADF